MGEIMDKHIFCRLYLKEIRKLARDLGIRVPKMTQPCVTGICNSKYFFIESREKIQTILFNNYACCAFDARAQAISNIISRYKMEND